MCVDASRGSPGGSFATCCFCSCVCGSLQGDSGSTDKPKKAESTSSYNYRVVKEVLVQSLSSSREHFVVSQLKELSLTELIPSCFPDPAAAQQAVRPGRPVGQEEQEAAAEVAAEHGGSRRGPGAAADPIREGSFGKKGAGLRYRGSLARTKRQLHSSFRAKTCACKTS